MQLEQSFTLPFSRATAWPAFADVPMLVSCMPGAALQGAPRPVEGGAELEILFTVKLGPITGAFQGQGAIRRDEAAQAGTFSGSGADRKSGSRVKGEAKFVLLDSAPLETTVNVTVDYALTGSLAQFSRGAIVKELAAALTRDFAANLRVRIAAAQAALVPEHPVNAPPSPGAAAGAQASPNAVVPAPLNAGRLFWRVLWARITGWLGRTAG